MISPKGPETGLSSLMRLGDGSVQWVSMLGCNLRHCLKTASCICNSCNQMHFAFCGIFPLFPQHWFPFLRGVEEVNISSSLYSSNKHLRGNWARFRAERESKTDRFFCSPRLRSIWSSDEPKVMNMHTVVHAGDMFDLRYRCEQPQKKRSNLMGDSVDETAKH